MTRVYHDLAEILFAALCLYYLVSGLAALNRRRRRQKHYLRSLKDLGRS